MKRVKLLFLGLTLLSFIFSCKAQNKSKAKTNAAVYSPSIHIDKLDDRVEETSGLIYFRGEIWTLNDSGGFAEIYRLDAKTGNVVQVIALKDVENIDFEDMTQDDDYIYIGDIGNNFGNRKNLVVYKLDKRDIPKRQDAKVQVEAIHFNYADQKSFPFLMRRNNYDCEAIASYSDHLLLFTKNWENSKTKMYVLPKTPGNYTLDIAYTFPSNGLITAAEFNKEDGMLSLLGYEDFMPFVWFFWDYEDNDFFNGQSRRFNLENIHGAQTEGICFNHKGDVFISSESSYFPQRLYKIPSEILTAKEKKIRKSIKGDPIVLKTEFKAKKDEIKIEIIGLEKGEFQLEILTEFWKSLKQLEYKAEGKKEELSMDADTMAAGMYYIRVEQQNRLKVSRVYIDKK